MDSYGAVYGAERNREYDFSHRAKDEAIALSANARGERVIADASIDHPLIPRTRSKFGQAHDSLRINSDTKRIDTTTQTMAR